MSGTNGTSGLRAKIAEHNTLRSELYESKVWGGAILEIRAMKLGARSRLNRDGYIDGKANQEKLYPLLLAESVFDPDTGKPVFPFDDGGEFVNSLDAAEVDRVAMIALKLAAMTDEEDKELKKSSATFGASDAASSSSPARSTPNTSSQKHSGRR